MPDEAEGAHRGLKVPDHDGAIGGARHDLLQVGIECHSAYGVLVPFEGALERWVACRLSQLVGIGARFAWCCLHFCC